MKTINADELCRAIKIEANPYGKPTLDFKTACTILDMIADAPAVDAVPVVRCKDCKYRQGNTCDYSAVWTRPNGYCQWGERREDETD